METNLTSLVSFAADERANGIDKRIVLIDGSEYLMVDDVPVDVERLVNLSKEIVLESVDLSTLQGVVDFFKAKIWDPVSDLFIHVTDENTVYVESKTRRLGGELPMAAIANYHPPDEKFGQWMETDSFMTWLLSGFVPNDDSRELQELLGRGAKLESVRQVADDGVATDLKVSRGVKIEWQNGVKPHWTLVPRRTFPEVTQPEALCTLRFKNNPDNEHCVKPGRGRGA